MWLYGLSCHAPIAPSPKSRYLPRQPGQQGANVLPAPNGRTATACIRSICVALGVRQDRHCHSPVYAATDIKFQVCGSLGRSGQKKFWAAFAPWAEKAEREGLPPAPLPLPKPSANGYITFFFSAFRAAIWVLAHFRTGSGAFCRCTGSLSPLAVVRPIRRQDPSPLSHARVRGTASRAPGLIGGQAGKDSKSLIR